MQRNLDSVLNSLDPVGADNDIRDQAAKAQELFGQLGSCSENERESVISAIRVILQDSISSAKSRAFVRIPTV